LRTKGVKIKKKLIKPEHITHSLFWNIKNLKQFSKKIARICVKQGKKYKQISVKKGIFAHF